MNFPSGPCFVVFLAFCIFLVMQSLILGQQNYSQIHGVNVYSKVNVMHVISSSFRFFSHIGHYKSFEKSFLAMQQVGPLLVTQFIRQSQSPSLSLPSDPLGISLSLSSESVCKMEENETPFLLSEAFFMVSLSDTACFHVTEPGLHEFIF